MDQRDDQVPTYDDPAENESPAAWLKRNGLILAILLGIASIIVIKGWSITAIAIVAAGLGFVIFVHELGHFLAAKACDVYVETFSIGFGPALPLCKHKFGETTYKLGLIPLGGYVKMLGEGAEGEESEDDPRSFKNKTVGQRMVIISAGVIMNMLFAVIGFVCIYMGPGNDRGAGVIGTVDPGSAAWEAGVRSGAEVIRIGKKENPYFQQIKPAVMLSGKNEVVPVILKMSNSDKLIETALEPRYDADGVGQKLIGIGPASSTIVTAVPAVKQPAYIVGTAAGEATPPFQEDDRIIATTDPANPSGPPLDLPADPRYPVGDRRDYFELYRRLVDLAGQPMIVVVKNAAGEKRQISVPPAYTRDYGMIMRMGPITSIRNDSPASKAGVQPKSEGKIGDIIEQVEVKTADGVLRFTNSRQPTSTPGVTELPLDPMRLPFELEKWAAKAPEPREVKIGVLRQSGHVEKTKVQLTLNWDPSWKYDHEMPRSSRSPLAVAGLGLAYRVETVVADVTKGGAADVAGIKVNDIVEAVKSYRDAEFKTPIKMDLKSDEWAFFFSAYWDSSMRFNPGRVDITVKRGTASIETTLQPPEDKTWPIADRGFFLDDDTRLVTANSPIEAISLGWTDVTDTAKTVYLSLLRMVDGGISFMKNANGPLYIASVSYGVASQNLTKFVLLLCMLSVNLAVLNFLPIPVLDGGHMVFLLYEKFAGRPAPEIVRTSATFAGMALLLSLMLCVIVLDVRRLFF